MTKRLLLGRKAASYEIKQRVLRRAVELRFTAFFFDKTGKKRLVCRY